MNRMGKRHIRAPEGLDLESGADSTSYFCMTVGDIHVNSKISRIIAKDLRKRTAAWLCHPLSQLASLGDVEI